MCQDLNLTINLTPHKALIEWLLIQFIWELLVSLKTPNSLLSALLQLSTCQMSSQSCTQINTKWQHSSSDCLEDPKAHIVLLDIFPMHSFLNNVMNKWALNGHLRWDSMRMGSALVILDISFKSTQNQVSVFGSFSGTKAPLYHSLVIKDNDELDVLWCWFWWIHSLSLFLWSKHGEQWLQWLLQLHDLHVLWVVSILLESILY